MPQATHGGNVNRGALAVAVRPTYPSLRPRNPARNPMGAPPPPSSGDNLRPALRLLMLVALYSLPILTAVRPIADPVLDSDIWWHLRVGQWVCEHHAVPTNDPLTLYGQDRPWVAYSWLFEVMLYGLYSWLGLAGIIVYRVVLSFAVTAALHRLVARREPRFLVATLLAGVGVSVISVLFDERPWLFTILFTILTLDVILDMREGRSNGFFWLLPVVYALWANLHIQFVYGLGVLTLACVAPVLDRVLRRGAFGEAPASFDSPAWRRLLLLTNLCLLATVLNPYPRPPLWRGRRVRHAAGAIQPHQRAESSGVSRPV